MRHSFLGNLQKVEDNTSLCNAFNQYAVKEERILHLRCSHDDDVLDSSFSEVTLRLCFAGKRKIIIVYLSDQDMCY